MIFIFTALMCEAKPLIRYYNLKKNNERTIWELYENPDCDITLAVTGTGPIAASAAVSSVLTGKNCGEGDFIINIGSCCNRRASDNDIGALYLINKLTDMETGRDFYPDMLIDSELPERSLASSARPAFTEKQSDGRELMTDWSFGGSDIGKAALYDMEGAFIYQTVRYYLGPSRVAFLKLVSDNGIEAGNNMFSELAVKIEELMTSRLEAIARFIDEVKHRTQELSDVTAGAYERDITEKLKNDLRSSVTMENQLRQLIKYAVCAGIDMKVILDKMYQPGFLPVKSKKDGLKALKQLSEAVTGYDG